MNPDLAHGTSYSAKAKNGMIYINPDIFLGYEPLRRNHRMAHEFRHLWPSNEALLGQEYAAIKSPAEDDAEKFADELFGKGSR